MGSQWDRGLPEWGRFGRMKVGQMPAPAWAAGSRRVVDRRGSPCSDMTNSGFVLQSYWQEVQGVAPARSGFPCGGLPLCI